MSLETIITAAWEQRDSFSTSTQGEVRKAVDAVISDIDSGMAANGRCISG